MAQNNELIPWQRKQGDLNQFIMEGVQELDVKWMTRAGNMYLVPGKTNVNLSPFAAQHLISAFSSALVISVVFPTAHLGTMVFLMGWLFSNIYHRFQFERNNVLIKASRFQGINNTTLNMMSLEMNAARGNKEAYQHLLNSYLSNAYIQVNPNLLSQGSAMGAPGATAPMNAKGVNSLGFIGNMGSGFMNEVRDAVAQSKANHGGVTSAPSSMPFIEQRQQSLSQGSFFPFSEENNKESNTPRNGSDTSDEALLSALVKEDKRYSALEKLHESRDRLTVEQATMVESCLREARASYDLLREAREASSFSSTPSLSSSEETAFKELSEIIFHAADSIEAQVSRDRLERMMSANSYMRDKFKPQGELTL